MNINHFFESFLAWKYDTGMFYITGRDIMMFILGMATCLLITLCIMCAQARIEEIRK